MAYVLISRQDKDCSTNEAIRFVSEDPRKALDAAREIQSEKDDWDKLFAMEILMYEIETNKLISISAYDHASTSKPCVYYSSSGKSQWFEQFFGTFKRFNLHMIGVLDKEQEKASSGKFRAIIIFDSDGKAQVDEDTNTVEEAYELCRLAAFEAGYPFQVFNDHGESQCDEKGQLIKKELVS